MGSPLDRLRADTMRTIHQHNVFVGLEQEVAPTVEPLTTAEAKAHLRVDFADDDTLIDALVKSARRAVERHLRKSLITQQWKLTLDTFPSGSAICLPLGPLQAVTSVTTYDDTDTGTVFASSNYVVDTAGDRVALNLDAVWPSDLRPYNAVEILYTTGYGDASTDIPSDYLEAVRLLVGHYYENREAVVAGSTAALPLGVTALLQASTEPRL